MIDSPLDLLDIDEAQSEAQSEYLFREVRDLAGMRGLTDRQVINVGINLVRSAAKELGQESRISLLEFLADSLLLPDEVPITAIH